MRPRLAVPALLFPFCLNAVPSGVLAQSVAQQKKSAPGKRNVNTSSLTGCVDEKQPDGYVLVEDRTLRTVAVLQAEGFPQEGFAKYLGKRVSVRGRTAAEQGRTVMRVQRIDKLADVCAPAQ